jgi:hypothetical protein
MGISPLAALLSSGALERWAAGPVLVACALLVSSGATKLVRPRGTRAAARALGLPSSRAAVIALGAVELVAGVAGVAAGGLAAIAVAVVYALLALAVARLLRRAPTVPCGCFGSTTSTASPIHVAVNVVAACVAAVAATHGSPLDAFSGGAMANVVLVALVVAGVALVELVTDALPELQRLTNPGSG